jgi:pyruvate formate lyase activating enzyme
VRKLARLWDKLDGGKVKCYVCANECVITKDKVGICRTRKNIDGSLYTLIYGSLIDFGRLDPIEKKPLYNFYPGTEIYSIASIGCSFRCLHCQNWSISQASPDEDGQAGTYDFENYEDQTINLVEMTPKELVTKVLESGATSLAYTYNEPLIWHEWVLDTAQILKENNIKTVLVTNGYSTPEATQELIDVGIDAANVDIKGITDDFYKKICGVKAVTPVLNTCKRFKQGGIHLEITNLIIPDLNDNKEDLSELCDWVVNNLGENTPLHFSAYHPDFKMPSKQRTAIETLELAYEIAKEKGLNYVYIGNVLSSHGNNTYCPKCNQLLISRMGFSVSKVNITKNLKCSKCDYDLHEDIIGIFH